MNKGPVVQWLLKQGVGAQRSLSTLSPPPGHERWVGSSGIPHQLVDSG